VRDEFDSSASDNLLAPSTPILVAVLSEKRSDKSVIYSRDKVL
jgi:hypothetical protein